MNKYLCCDQSILQFMDDYIKTIIIDLQLQFLILNDMNKYPYNTKNIYVFVQRIPGKLLSQSQYFNNIFLLNTEQCTKNFDKNYLKNILNNNIKVIDYSLENIKCFDNSNILYLPYQYNISEIDKLKKFITMNDKKYDVAFIGAMSPKRKKICDELINKGINLNIVNGWSDNRDIAISSAKVVLNIHYNDEYNIYESFRCDRWIFSGMLLISEKSIDNGSLDINDLVIFEDYDKLVDTVINVINNYDKYYKTFISSLDKNINNIKNERYCNLNYVTEAINNAIVLPNIISEDIIQINELYYGNKPNIINIIDHKDIFINMNTITISDNILLNNIFGDPCPNIEKKIYLNILYDNKLYKYEISEKNGKVCENFTISIDNMKNMYLVNIIDK